MRKIEKGAIEQFKMYLLEEEKADATVDKYVHDVCRFSEWLAGKEFDKSDVLRYKAELCATHAPAGVNVALSSLNRFFLFCEWYELRVKRVKVQRQLFASRDRELSKSDYERLLTAAKKKNNQRLFLVMQTICSTGIRVSELRYITMESVEQGVALVNCKSKFFCRGNCAEY